MSDKGCQITVAVTHDKIHHASWHHGRLLGITEAQTLHTLFYQELGLLGVCCLTILPEGRAFPVSVNHQILPVSRSFTGI